MHNVNDLVEINKDFDHAILLAKCSDPNVQSFSEKLNLFTNSKYNKIVNDNHVMYLFES